jgi:protein-L-isoaspartate(D-aspartate) O-methyltransferase
MGHKINASKLIMLLRATVSTICMVVMSWLLVSCEGRTMEPSTTLTPISLTGTQATAEAIAESLVTARHQMVEEQIRAMGITDSLVLAAMDVVPRHLFVPPQSGQEAYADRPLPIGYGQTISSPYIVAWMTELLRLKPGDKVLEIGTGSGYQAAILDQMGMEVYSVEIIEPLVNEAAVRLAKMGYISVTVLAADGYYGWVEHAPYDAIIVSCAPDHIPPELVAQLADGGRMVLPVGPPGYYQTLWLVEKHGDQITTINEGGVRFVPLTGQH